MSNLSTRIGRYRQSATQKGGKAIMMVFVYLIIAAVSFYGDGVFVWMNIGHYTGQYAAVFQVFLVLGAFCTSASIMLLLFGKAHWFTPGTQMIVAYIFTGVEVTVNVANIIIALNPNLGIVELWRIFSPATPFVALVGWIIVLNVDKAQRERHQQMEMEEEINDSKRQYELMTHEANMEVKFKYLDMTRQRLQQELNSQAAQQIIAQHAQNLTAQVLNDITGLPVIPQTHQQQAATFNQTAQQSPLQLPTLGTVNQSNGNGNKTNQ